jgi:hypothetical protein
MMKIFGKSAICLAGWLALDAALRADDVVLPGNPYAPMVVRNIFGLNPPPLVDPNAPTVEPPVKITPNGIMTIFGQLQVLFKVAASKPGDKENSYILTEGQRQDDIEVTKIDENAGVVTFNNHGIVQALPLVPATPSSTPAPTPSFGSTPSPAMPGGNNGFNNRFGNRGGNFPGRNRGNNGGDNSGGMNNGYNGSNLQSVPTRGYQTSQGGSQMTPEEQMIMIAAQHAKAQQEGDPAAVIFPPTPLDKDAGVSSPNDPPAP